MAPEVYASGKNAEVWAAGLKYDANNIYWQPSILKLRI